MNLTRQCSVCPRTPPCRHRQPNNNLRVGHSAGATSPIPPSARLPAPEVTSNDCSNDRIDDRLRSTVNRVRGRMNRNHPRPRPGRMGVNPPTRRVPEGSPVIEGAEEPPGPTGRSVVHWAQRPQQTRQQQTPVGSWTNADGDHDRRVSSLARCMGGQARDSSQRGARDRSTVWGRGAGSLQCRPPRRGIAPESALP